jgi:hypothetical protein
MSAAMGGLAFASSTTQGQVRADGRWAGAITSRPLPARDDEIEAMPVEVRAHLAGIWLGQAATEARVARSFAVIHESLERLRAADGLIALAHRAIDDEHRHATLCEEVAGRYLGRVCGPHRQLPAQRPRHPSASSDDVRAALFVIGQCALNETFASVYLSCAYRGAKSPLAHAAIRELLEDEVDHSRLGWAFLGQLRPELRAEVSDWLVPLAISNLREWRAIGTSSDERLVRHGVPPTELVLAELTTALDTLLVPGFRRSGLDTRAIERWIAAGARTDAS